MNDRDLSRGKTIYGPRPHFVTGHYVSVPRPMIVSTKTRIGGGWDADDVDPATIGLCTGLRDENGTLIFEGDILQWQRADIKNPEILQGIVTWRFDQWHVIYDTECDRWWILSAVVDRGAEIIGNVHDNPELLAGTERSGDDEL